MSAAEQRIRQVAIVLQSLDAKTARRLLSQLPPELGRAVRQTIVQLKNVTSSERAKAISDLQGLFSNLETIDEPSLETSLSPAVQLLSSSPMGQTIDRIEISSQVTQTQEPVSRDQSRASEIPWLAWDPGSLATFLANERPTVIATVLNQLSPERAKALLDHLPIETAGATLAAIPNLFLVDPSILNDILAEIDRRLPRHPPIPTTATIAGVSKFSGPQKQAWLNAIAQQNPEIAMQLGWQPSDSMGPFVAASKNRTMEQQTGRDSQSESKQINAPKLEPATAEANDIFASTAPVVGMTHPSTGATVERSDSPSLPGLAFDSSKSKDQGFETLLQLTDGDFVVLLHSCPREKVLTALCGATPAMITRVEKLIPRTDLKRFRNYLKQLDSRTAIDVEKAQSEILERATQLMASGRIGALENITFLAAA
jgi:flagellar motor switch protein FliG